MSRKTIECLSTLTLGAMLALSGIHAAVAADGQELAEPCADCHGDKGASTAPDVPIIGGLSAFYIQDSMLNYQDEARPCPESEYLSGDKKGQKATMCEIANELDDDEIEKIGAYFADQPFVRADQDFDADLAAKGEAIHEESCKKCHADGGSLPSDDSGILAGQWTPYLRQSFAEFSAGDRPMVKKMKPKYEKLEQTELEALLHYYARQASTTQASSNTD